MNLSTVFRSLKAKEKVDVLVGLGASKKCRSELLNGGLGKVAEAGKKIREGCGAAAVDTLLELGELYAAGIGLGRIE